MFVSIALSALCSMLEATLLSTPLSYITGLEEQGVKGAQRLKKLKQNSDRPISAILCLNTIANTVGASIVGSLVYEVYGDALVGVFSTIFTLCILLLSEIIPKTIGTSYWRSLALPASVIINAMIFIALELTSFFGFREISQLCREIPQCHNDKSGTVFSRTSGQAGHTFSAIPYCLAFKKLFYFIVISALDSIHDLSRIVPVEFCGRTDGRTGPAVYAGLQALPDTIVLAEHII